MWGGVHDRGKGKRFTKLEIEQIARIHYESEMSRLHICHVPAPGLGDPNITVPMLMRRQQEDRSSYKEIQLHAFRYTFADSFEVSSLSLPPWIT